MRVADVGAVQRNAQRRLSEALFVAAEVRVVAPGTIERVESGKVKRVDDRRKLGPT